MDWTTFVATWGPAAPFLVVFLKAYWDMVYKIVPHGLRGIRVELRRHEGAAERRHQREAEALRRIEEAIADQSRRCTRPKRKRRGKPPAK